MEAAPISENDYNELKRTMRELTAAVTTLTQQVAVHNAEQKPFESKVNEHERILRGDYSNVGLIAKTDKLERGMENINKAAWAFFAPAIALVFIGMLAAIYIALKGGIP